MVKFRAHSSIALAIVFACSLTALRTVSGGAMAGAHPASPQSGKQITVAAAISMKDVLEALEKKFSARPGAVEAVFNFGASGILEKQIEEGAPIDIFISAAPTQMNTLEEKGLVLAGTRRNLARNRLVLIVPAGSTVVKRVEDLKKPQVRVIAIGEIRSVPAGQYAAEALRNLGLFDALQSKFVYAQNVRAVLTYVSGGNADAGFVYETDAKPEGKVSIVEAVPASSYQPVVYPGAILRNAPNATGARTFLDFLASPEARKIFEQYGFSAPLD